MAAVDEAQSLANKVVDSAQELANITVDLGEDAAGAVLAALLTANKLVGEALESVGGLVVKK